MEKNFEVSDCISRAMDILKANAGFLILTPLVYWVASNIVGSSSSSYITEAYTEALPQIMDGTVDWDELMMQIHEAQAEMMLSPMFWISIVLSIVLSVFYQVGYGRFQLQAIDGEKLDANGFLARFDTYVQYFITTLVYAIVTALGMLCFVLPGIYIGIRLMLAPYYVIDHGMNCEEALKTCWRDMSGNWIKVFCAALLLLLIGIGGYLLCCVGALFTIPLVGVATALLYREVSKQQG